MSDSEKIKSLVMDIEKTLARYRSEFDMTAAAVVGALEYLKHGIMKETFEADDE